MKNVKIIIISVIALLCFEHAPGQSKTDEQMDRDIEVMKEIISQLFTSQVNKSSRLRISANYLNGYGLIFKIPRFNGYFFPERTQSEVYTTGVGANEFIYGQNIFSLKQKDSVDAANNQYFNMTIQSFIIDYGDLIEGLKESDKILVVYKSGSENHTVSNLYVAQKFHELNVLPGDTDTKLTAQVAYKDIMSFNEGKISENQLKQKITFSKKQNNDQARQEFEIFGTILGKIYSYNNDNGYYSINSVTYERFEGLGVIYEILMKNNLRNALSLRLPKPATTKSDQVVIQHQNDYKSKLEQIKVENVVAYESLRTDLTQNLIKYGKTLKSLASDEVLMLSVRLPGCYSCEMPEKINLVVKAGVLKDYVQRKITLDDAVKKIDVKEVR